GFDERFFMYYEDTDISWRARLAGYRVVYTADSVVRHVHLGTTNPRSRRFQYLTERNRLLMLGKDASRLRWIRALARMPLRIAVIAARERDAAGNAGRTATRMAALRDVLLGMPVTLKQRARIQTLRRVESVTVERWLLPPP